MKKGLKSLIVAAAVLSSSCFVAPATAQVKVTADVVSTYIWRGVVGSSGANFQPTLAYAAKGFEIGAWGSMDFIGSYKEVDLYATYTLGGLKLGVTDYFWTPGIKYFTYKNDVTSHMLEGTIGYTISQDFPLSIAVNTMFYGADKKPDDTEKQNYSTYIELGYTWSMFTAAIGVMPADGMYGDGYGGYEGVAVCNMSLFAAKSLKITEDFSLPIKAGIIANPQAEDIHMVFGITF